MAIAAAMNPNDDKDDHENDVVMPGFRFHPTEEELIEFYLRRKVQGKRFNVDLITFLDLYRYDPWELPALAAIGEKEWYFYVPRDRKYRNGDRPNRVTTSGYWKATGADRMIRAENFRSIGLKKTLVFYSGKAPKGIRTSWIMNEYRLPQHETDQYQKAEISLCRVYKRPGVEDHSPLPNSVSSKPSSSRGVESSKKSKMGLQATSSSQSLRELSLSSEMEKLQEGSGSSNNYTGDAYSLPLNRAYSAIAPIAPIGSSSMELDGNLSQYQPKQAGSSLPICTLFPPSSTPMIAVDELNRLVDYQHLFAHQNAQIFPSPASQLPSLPLNTQPNSLSTFSDKLWEWNPIPDASRDYNAFK
ncbi:NAC domain-containing protein 35 [Cinnamomum micranthum f. kanehirae]|uniref:NAC domain-containing protein 35 n=1 Tax=Cinnamomum micranthum f. kanehirae TaxID=337451 RepID=A0A443PPN9_9MAGN|nr:NAC domain-containing protein 35 [Cinnamomum micranthum f. kanehirae]